MSKNPKLPSGWVLSTIGEVCEPSQYGYTAKALASGRTHYLRTTDITSGSINWVSVPYCDIPENEEPKYLLNDGDVVISRAGSVGFSCLILNPAKSVFASYLIRFRPLILPKYFSYFLNTPTYWESIGERSLGIAVQNVNATNLSEIQIPIAPKAEQTRIAEKLEELFSDLDAGVAELKAAQKRLAQYRQSLLKSAVEGVLTAEWRTKNKPNETGAQLLERILKERRARWEEKQLAKFKEQGKIPPKGWQDKYPEPVQPDTTNLPELPDGWVWASIDQCSLDETAITDGPFGSNLKSEHYQEHGPRVIRLQNIGDGVFVDVSAHISKEHYSNLLKHSVSKDDLVVAMLGEVLPRACIVPDGVAPAIVKADCARIRVNQKLILPIIMMSYLNSPPTRERVVSLVKGIGRPRINLGHIRAIAVPICSQAEQQALMKTLIESNEAIEQQFESIELGLKQTAAQRKNILKSAFSGQLVPQDSKDEPASVLLERIREERKKQSSLPKQRKVKVTKEISIVSRKLIDVLTEAGDWLPAQEAFHRCGIADGATTEEIEDLYSELRKLDKEKIVVVEPVVDANGMKQYDRLRLAEKG